MHDPWRVTTSVAQMWSIRLSARVLCALLVGCANEQEATSSGGGSAGTGLADGSGAGKTDSPGTAGGGAGAAADGGSGWGGGESAADAWGPPAPAGDAGIQADSNAPDSTTSGDGSSDGGSTDGGSDTSAPQCNETEPVTLYLSADDSNSMASATVTRGLIEQGQYAYKPLRAYEFLNYYHFDYPAALPGHVSPSIQLAAEPGDSATFRLQIGLRAPDFAAATRRRFNVVLAVDTSASMGWGVAGETGLDRARAACVGLVQSLSPGDHFALVAWGGAAVGVPVDVSIATDGDAAKLQSACMALQAGGDTPLSAGLGKAYAIAQQHALPSRINRVVLISDGGANVGEKDAQLIAAAAKNAEGKDDGTGIYLMGAGVGDPWNYNDQLMDTVTDAGKGAYVFLDSQAEAGQLFATSLLRHLEVAARNVQVQVTLPPTFAIQQFYGEQVSTKADDVEPQHLAANDAMVFHQTITSCNPKALKGNELVQVKATWQDPQTLKIQTDSWSAPWSSLLQGPHALLDKGAAVVAVVDALKAIQQLEGKDALAELAKAAAKVATVQQSQPTDADLQELAGLLASYAKTLKDGQIDASQQGGTGAAPITSPCTCKATGTQLEQLGCALDLCGAGVLLDHKVTSPTQSPTEGTYAAVARFGDAANDLGPQVGASYALLASGPATGSNHSVDLGGQAGQDPFAPKSPAMYNAIQWRLHLKAPAGAHGIRFRHVFFSEEYDDYVGSQFNDKFYAILEAGSTNGGTPTVINYTGCRDPKAYHDFVCSPGMQFCNPKARYCYLAVNTAMSECCWLGGCPQGKATTDIGGTGFSCAASPGVDGQTHGSSTGWLMTEWPIEPGEEFWLTFHVHDTGDGVFDSEVILDGLQFVGAVTPGTWTIPPM